MMYYTSMVLLLINDKQGAEYMKLKKKAVSNSISNQVYELLKENIINLNLKPGLNISEKEISEKLEVSRTPVREAFVRLAQEELLEIYPQKGTFVSLINLDDVEEARFIREHLEKATVRLACQNWKPNQLQELKNNMIMQSNSIDEKNFDEFFRLDEEFHRMIVEIADKKMVWLTIQRLDSHLKRIRILSLADTHKSDIVVNEHKEILKAIEERNEKKAEQVLWNHLTRLIIEKEELKKTYPQYFS